MNAFVMPDRNVLIGALAAIITWIGSVVAERQFGITLSVEVMAALPVLVGFVLTHIIPMSKQNIIDKLDDDVVRDAQLDPNSNVSYVIPPVPVPPGEEPTIRKP